MTRICLNMIVKNESQIILRCLRSVAPIIDRYSILDTGSTDDTRALINAFMFGHNIGGQLKRGNFENFSQARNLALEHAEDMGGFDYHLLVDADMEWCGVLDKEDLTEDAYYIRQKDFQSKAEFDNIRLVKRDIGAQYVGVTHEYLNVPTMFVPPPALRGGMFIDYANGANRPGKFERDIALLEAECNWDALKASKTEVTCPADKARSLFYLAQSYKDAGRYGDAANAYVQRAGMLGTWEEERWYAGLMAGRCMMTLGHHDLARRFMVECHAQRPWRREPLRDLARYYLDKANAITDTRDDILFLEP